MLASLLPAELRHHTAVLAPLNKDSLLNQIYPPCHFHCHLIICLYFLAALMQCLLHCYHRIPMACYLTKLDGSPLVCFLRHPLDLIKGKHLYCASIFAYFLPS